MKYLLACLLAPLAEAYTPLQYASDLKKYPGLSPIARYSEGLLEKL